MRRRRVSVLLLDKSLASMRRAIGAFNGKDDDGRQSAVLLHLQHAAEMLLKAGLSEKKVKVFDSRSGRSIGFERCLALASEHLSVTADQTGTLRTVDALRDDEQHWLGQVCHPDVRSVRCVQNVRCVRGPGRNGRFGRSGWCRGCCHGHRWVPELSGGHVRC
jgi:hypothetical protein